LHSIAIAIACTPLGMWATMDVDAEDVGDGRSISQVPGRSGAGRSGSGATCILSVAASWVSSRWQTEQRYTRPATAGISSCRTSVSQAGHFHGMTVELTIYIHATLEEINLGQHFILGHPRPLARSSIRTAAKRDNTAVLHVRSARRSSHR
jgi:hypothetical protein